jgi:NTE family protein
MAADLRIGLALGSGGARGLAHVGVMEVLEAEGIKPFCIAGASMGAIIGGLYAEYPQADVTWRRLQRYVEDEDFAASWSAFVSKESMSTEEQPSPGRFHEMYDFVQRKIIALKTVTRPYLQDAERLRRPLETLFEARTFMELKIPFACVALDLVTGAKVVFREGDLIEGIYASSAIPAIFPAVERDGKMIVDGGSAFRVPVDVAREMGADCVIAVDIPAFEQKKYRTGLEIIIRSNAIARQRLNNFVLATADFVIRPEVDDIHWADFRAGDICRERGATAARAALPQLEAILRERRSTSYLLRRRLARLLKLEQTSTPPDAF